jgi:hypothetical protein
MNTPGGQVISSMIPYNSVIKTGLATASLFGLKKGKKLRRLNKKKYM